MWTERETCKCVWRSQVCHARTLYGPSFLTPSYSSTATSLASDPRLQVTALETRAAEAAVEAGVKMDELRAGTVAMKQQLEGELKHLKAEMRGQTDERRSDKKGLEEELAAARSSDKQARKEVAALSSKLEVADAAAQRRDEEARKEMERGEQRVASLQTQLAEAESARTAVVSARDEARASMEELAKKHEDERVAAQGAAAEAAEELGRLREEAEGLRSEAAGEAGRHHEELREAEGKLTEMRKTREELNEKLEAAEAAAVAAAEETSRAIEECRVSFAARLADTPKVAEEVPQKPHEGPRGEIARPEAQLDGAGRGESECVATPRAQLEEAKPACAAMVSVEEGARPPPEKLVEELQDKRAAAQGEADAAGALLEGEEEEEEEEEEDHCSEKAAGAAGMPEVEMRKTMEQLHEGLIKVCVQYVCVSSI